MSTKKSGVKSLLAPNQFRPPLPSLFVCLLQVEKHLLRWSGLFLLFLSRSCFVAFLPTRSTHFPFLQAGDDKSWLCAFTRNNLVLAAVSLLLHSILHPFRYNLSAFFSAARKKNQSKV